MTQARPQRPPLTKKQSDLLFLLLLEDDPVQLPPPAMGDLKFWALTSLVQSIHDHAREHRLGWYVTALLPVMVTLPVRDTPYRVCPDAFVTFGPDHARQAFDVDQEGGFPPFIIDVVSPDDDENGMGDNHLIYDLLGTQEYALFTPRDGRASKLEGYCRAETGAFESWPPDAEGRLWSAVLGLFLVVRGPLLQAQTADGRLLPTPEQSGATLREAIAARERVEAENARLREEITRLRGERGD